MAKPPPRHRQAARTGWRLGEVSTPIRGFTDVTAIKHCRITGGSPSRGLAMARQRHVLVKDRVGRISKGALIWLVKWCMGLHRFGNEIRLGVLMSHAYLPFPFSLPDVRADLTKRPADAIPATLPDHQLAFGGKMWLPGPVAKAGHQVDGVLVPFGNGIVNFTIRLGWALQETKVMANGEPKEVYAMLPDIDWEPGPFYDMGAWQAALFYEFWADFRTLPVANQQFRIPMMMARATARLAAKTPTPTRFRSNMGADLVKNHHVKFPHDGYFQFRKVSLKHPRFDGGLSAQVTREVFVGTDAAIVLPYDPVRDRVLLVEQFRMGPLERGDPLPFCLEPVAGRVDGGEHPEATARRECVEEAGLALKRLEHISSHYASPGASTEFFHCYIGLCDLPDEAQGRGGLADEDEDIRTHVIPFDQAIGLIATGEANIGPLVTILLWLERERPRLRANA